MSSLKLMQWSASPTLNTSPWDAGVRFLLRLYTTLQNQFNSESNCVVDFVLTLLCRTTKPWTCLGWTTCWKTAGPVSTVRDTCTLRTAPPFSHLRFVSNTVSTRTKYESPSWTHVQPLSHSFIVFLLLLFTPQIFMSWLCLRRIILTSTHISPSAAQRWVNMKRGWL